MDLPSRTIYTLDAKDGSDRVAVHPGGLQFVAGWQPLRNDSEAEDENDG
jgi:hypothetical protein